MIDILSGIIKGELTVEQAYDIMEETIDKFHKGEIEGELHLFLGLNNYEWTAISHSLDLQTLANWRKNGWPQKCYNCGSEIDYKKYGWRIKENKLKCLNCN